MPISTRTVETRVLLPGQINALSTKSNSIFAAVSRFQSSGRTKCSSGGYGPGSKRKYSMKSQIIGNPKEEKNGSGIIRGFWRTPYPSIPRLSTYSLPSRSDLLEADRCFYWKNRLIRCVLNSMREFRQNRRRITPACCCEWHAE